MSQFPFEEHRIDENTFVRRFDKGVDTSEMIWHRDRRNRVVHVLESSGWFFQRDDEIPVLMSPGSSFLIPAKTWHRAIRRPNSGDLVIRITEFDGLPEDKIRQER